MYCGNVCLSVLELTFAGRPWRYKVSHDFKLRAVSRKENLDMDLAKQYVLDVCKERNEICQSHLPSQTEDLGGN